MARFQALLFGWESALLLGPGRQGGPIRMALGHHSHLWPLPNAEFSRRRPIYRSPILTWRIHHCSHAPQGPL